MKRFSHKPALNRIFYSFLLSGILVAIYASTLQAQTFLLRSQEMRLGIYAGRGGYYGEYNPGFLGSPFVYGFDRTSPVSQKPFMENNFGGWLKLPINPTFGLVLRGDFGSLGYEDPKLNYRMATSFHAFGAGVEINPFHTFMVQPYLSLGAGMMRYELPPPIPVIDLAPNSPGAFKDKAQALYFPISLGVQYPVSNRAAFFVEYSFNLTNADNIDNLVLPQTGSGLIGNDAFAGVRVGINIAILKYLNLRRNRKAIRKPVYLQASAMESIAVEREKLRPLRLVPADTLRMYWEAMKAEQEMAKNITPKQKPPEPPVAAVTTPPVKPVPAPEPVPVPEPPKKIPVAKPPEQREFKQEEQKKVVQQVAIDRSRARAEAAKQPVVEPSENAVATRLGSEGTKTGRVDESGENVQVVRPAGPLKDKKELKNITNRADPTLYTDETDPFIPKIFIKPRAIPDEIIVDGFVTRDPPVGYYVQVYATVGPISAQRNRQKAIELLKDYLEDADRQVIITKRRQFYEVRIGVFDSYDDTVSVLEQVLGTYYDAYTLIYLSEGI